MTNPGSPGGAFVLHACRSTFVLASIMVVAAAAADLPGEGPRLGPDRITQADIESGRLTLNDIRRAGLFMFSVPFNKADGFGDGPMNPLDTRLPGGRPTLGGNGTFLRVNGLDAQSCLECHSIISNASVPAEMGVGGVGGGASHAIFRPTLIDVSDSLQLGQAAMDGRFINPPFLFGSGGIELLAREMTADLQALKQLARQSPGVPVPLDTKGVNFGTIVFDGEAFDTSAVEGVDPDLVVRPFGRKGEFATVRAFDEAALMFHMGMQPVELVGENVDADGDGVVNEVLVGELSALAIFNTTLPRPVEGRRSAAARAGSELFDAIGCSACHRRLLTTERSELDYQFPEDPANPSANVFYSVDLSSAPAGFRRTPGGGIEVPLYSDMKRHDMGPEMAEVFGSPLDAQFITARLWGVADTAPYMHDGRALTIGEAILMHGGEAQAQRDAYASLTEADQARLLEFLMTLRTPRKPVADLQPKR